MKKTLFAVLLFLSTTVLVFADLEWSFGLIGGYGPAAIIGFNFQIGYLSPVANTSRDSVFRWSILADLGIGVRYKPAAGPYGEYISSYDKYTGEPETKPYHMTGGDYNIGLRVELYPFMNLGIALGGGITNGAGWIDRENPFNPYITPYVRAEIPILLKYIKIGLGFDYIFWKNEPVPAGITLPDGYRINLLFSIRKDGWKAIYGIK
jgi:hypothetical protein